MRFPPSRVVRKRDFLDIAPDPGNAPAKSARASNGERYHERHLSSPDRLSTKRREPSCQLPTTAELSAAIGLLGRCSGFAGQCEPDQRSG
ncbi:hypothetical protein CDAR_109291 [Caerostris darwini]|uniref:Uncharacterized protein n=1 Tax=Caerostris darwini TaxID=1538125 RepID=A0AAV4TQQ9_9ARAC|nr:hypothetical protein CDAR_109291 [Caerostris darwini]